MKVKVKTILFDICGVLGDARGTVPWKIKVAMEEANLSEKYGIGFIELMKAYSSGGFNGLWRKYKMKSPDIGKYFETWEEIEEYPPGSVKIYHEVPFVFNKLINAKIRIVLLTRLTNQNVINVLSEIKKRGFEGDIESDIEVFNPQNDEERQEDKRFVEKVMFKAFKETQGPRIYVDDGLDRVVHLKEWDSNLFAIGSTRGFYSIEDIQTMYYKADKELVFKNFKSESDARDKGYSKLFDAAITNLEDLFNIIDR